MFVFVLSCIIVIIVVWWTARVRAGESKDFHRMMRTAHFFFFISDVIGGKKKREREKQTKRGEEKRRDDVTTNKWRGVLLAFIAIKYTNRQITQRSLERHKRWALIWWERAKRKVNRCEFVRSIFCHPPTLDSTGKKDSFVTSFSRSVCGKTIRCTASSREQMSQQWRTFIFVRRTNIISISTKISIRKMEFNRMEKNASTLSRWRHMSSCAWWKQMRWKTNFSVSTRKSSQKQRSFFSFSSERFFPSIWMVVLFLQNTVYRTRWD